MKKTYWMTGPTVFGALLTLAIPLSVANAVQSYWPKVDALVGSDLAGDCINCINRSKAFAECHHFNPPGDTSCNPNMCLEDYYAWIECTPKPPSGTGNCKTKQDPNQIWRSQNVRQAKNLTCNDTGDPAVDGGFVPIPGIPAASTCIPGGSQKGKCFIPTCDGTIIRSAGTFFNGTVCN